MARPGEPGSRDGLALYDEPAMQSRFVRRARDGTLEADFIVEGMTCAACAWLVEHAIARIPGVKSAQVNFTTGCAQVRWRDGEARASEIFAAAQDCGCKAWPFETGRLENPSLGTVLKAFATLGIDLIRSGSSTSCLNSPPEIETSGPFGQHPTKFATQHSLAVPVSSQ